MKKVFASLLLTMLLALPSAAQKVSFHMGVQGGVTLDKLTSAVETFKGGMLPGWHAGLTFDLKLPAYFSIQPSVNFQQSRSKVLVDDVMDPVNMNSNLINVPVAIQWGPDLGLVRLFAQLVPYVDFAVGGGYKLADEQGNVTWQSTSKYLQTAQFGVGVGGGLEVWRIQISARYNWGLGDWRTMTQSNPFKNMGSNRRGVTVTLAYMFY